MSKLDRVKCLSRHIRYWSPRLNPVLLTLCVVFGVAATVRAQTVAILSVERDDQTRELASKLAEDIASNSNLKVLDLSLAEAAFSSSRPTEPFNMTVHEGKRIGAVTGSNAFLLLRSALQRRSAFGRPDYYEAYAVISGVSSRTGQLIYWKLHSFESEQSKKAVDLLMRSIPKIGGEIAASINDALRKELSEPDPPGFEEAPVEGPTADDRTRTPVPFRRLRPEYTAMAALYGVAATVDMMVYLDETGKIVRTEVVRWAGFGLDASVEDNIRSMNWRPAERNGKPLAMKFLVRYNFKKIDKTAN